MLTNLLFEKRGQGGEWYPPLGVCECVNVCEGGGGGGDKLQFSVIHKTRI